MQDASRRLSAARRNRLVRRETGTITRSARLALLVPVALALAGCSLNPGHGYDQGATAPVPLAKPAKRSGTLVVAVRAPLGALDPAFALTRPRRALAYVLCTPLLTYPDAGGAAGTALVPGLAARLPAVSRDGRNYTFTLKRGLTFSDGAPLEPEDIKASFERLLDPSLRSTGWRLFSDIVGVRAFRVGETEHVSGIRASSRSISFGLRRRDPSFLARVALPIACPVPRATPHVTAPDVLRTSASGPYRLADSHTLEQNPHFDPLLLGWRGRVARIVVRDRQSDAAIVAGVRSGELALSLDGLSPAGWAANPDVRHSRPRPTGELVALFMNREALPFDEVGVRKAIDHAIDRFAAARAFGGDPLAQRSAREILPRTLSAWRSSDGTRRADAAQARVELAVAGVALPLAVDLWVRDTTQQRAVARSIVCDLALIRIRATIHLFGPLNEHHEPPDEASLVLDSFRLAYADPSAILMPLFTGGDKLVPAEGFAHVGKRRLRTEILQTRRYAGVGRTAVFARLGRAIVDRDVPIAVVVHANFSSPVSSMLEGGFGHPVFDLDLATAELLR